MSRFTLELSAYNGGTTNFTINYSTDNITYTKIGDNPSTGAGEIEVSRYLINNVYSNIAYIKIIVASTNSLLISNIKIEADIDTSSVKNLYSAPKDRVMYETISSVLPSACVRAYRRDSKFGFPAIEFTDASENYIGHEFLAFDFTGMALFFDQQTVIEDGFITITSTENPEVDVHGTLTSNRLLVASNPDENGSLQGKVIYSSINQGLIYDVRDVRKDINKLVKGVEEKDAARKAEITTLENYPFNLKCPFPLRSGTPLLKILPFAGGSSRRKAMDNDIFPIKCYKWNSRSSCKCSRVI